MIIANKYPGCDSGCIRRMNVPEIGKGNFAFYKGTLDCPAHIGDCDPEVVEAMTLCGCCSFEDGTLATVSRCRFRIGDGGWAECDCHNTMIVYGTCLSKRNHGKCPYGLKGVD
jgi:hypothetical protein